MNRVFAAKLPDGQTGLSDPVEASLEMAAFSSAPGTIPATVNPPRDPSASAADQRIIRTGCRRDEAVIGVAGDHRTERRVGQHLQQSRPQDRLRKQRYDRFGEARRARETQGSRCTAHGPASHRSRKARSAQDERQGKGQTGRAEADRNRRPPLKPAAATDAPTPPASVPGAAPGVVEFVRQPLHGIPLSLRPCLDGILANAGKPYAVPSLVKDVFRTGPPHDDNRRRRLLVPHSQGRRSNHATRKP